MKWLFQAGLRSRRHLHLVIFTFATLIALTLAAQLEMFALGFLSDQGADFFALFGGDKKIESFSGQGITKEDIDIKWAELDTDGSGVLTKEKAGAYLAKQKETNPLSWVFRACRTKYPILGNFTLIILLLLGVAVFKAIWLFASRYCTQLLSIRISRDLRQQYFEHIQSLPMSFYQKHNIGTLTSRVVGDAGQVASSLNSCLTNYLQSPFTLISSFIICFYLSWKLSLILFFGMPLIAIPIITLARRTKRVSRKLQSNQERFASILIDFLSGIQTVKIFAMEAFSLKKYKEQNDEMARLETKSAKYGMLSRPILHAITTLCLATIVLFGLHVLHMSISQLIVFCGLLQVIYEPMRKFAEENTNVQRGIVAAERMFEVLEIKSPIQDAPGAVPMVGFKEGITFDKVWFRYGEDWVLRDFSVTIKKGEAVALVGPTGAGKSTLIQLLPRLYDVERGEIRIDGIALPNYTQKSLREMIAIVSQKPFLFNDTVSANIAFGRDYSQEAIELAARRAHASDFIERLSQRYETMVNEGGSNFSGGQCQRMTIARALVKGAPILVLDEATSSLDALCEAGIKQALHELKGEVTQILIAHRLATLDHVDRIIYIEHGKKVDEGTKDELLKRCEGFRLMWESFFRAEIGNRKKSEAPATLPT